MSEPSKADSAPEGVARIGMLEGCKFSCMMSVRSM